MSDRPTIFELTSPGRTAIDWPTVDVPSLPVEDLLGEDNLRTDLPLPELSQIDVIRHYTHLSSINFGVDTGFYPLGSCTMKYNPKINDQIVAFPGVSRCHPYQGQHLSQGILRILFDMEAFLAEIAGMDAVTLQPAAGAQGEFTAMMVFKRHHERVGEGHRHIVIVPDSSHGTNPATAARCGYQIMKVPSGVDGHVDLSALEQELSNEVAAVMLTNPNTLGLFESQVLEIAEMVHKAGALLYCDGANMNAVMGITRPGDAGFDAMHFNLHKTFASPHGGGGPGSGPVAVKDFLRSYLPAPTIAKADGSYFFDYGQEDSIGSVHAFYGNIGVVVRAYAYILSLGADGLRQTSENAILNANYLLSKVADNYDVPYGRRCMHEFVASAVKQKARGVKALDIAKRLLDFDYHPPTIYFPLIVPEAMMIEPTETESIETLDAFADTLISIDKESLEDPELAKSAPHFTPVSRLDEAAAARKLQLRWNQEG